MQWCYTPGFTDPTNVITCQQWAQEVFASRNATIANWLYYDYNEVDQIGPIRSSPSLADQAYGSSLIACPEIELRINTCVPQLHSCSCIRCHPSPLTQQRSLTVSSISSRIYWILVLPNATNQSACALSAGDAANVLIVYFNGIDSKELLLAEADKRNMQVYLGSTLLDSQRVACIQRVTM